VIAVGAITVSGNESSRVAYEELRGLALGGSPCSGRFGLVVLLREGLAAWLAQPSIGLVSAAVRTPAQPDWHAQIPLVSDEIHAGVVRVMANMVLGGSHKKEIST
jgi:hypothetical protein